MALYDEYGNPIYRQIPDGGRIDARPRNSESYQKNVRSAHYGTDGQLIGGYTDQGKAFGTKAGKGKGGGLAAWYEMNPDAVPGQAYDHRFERNAGIAKKGMSNQEVAARVAKGGPIDVDKVTPNPAYKTPPMMANAAPRQALPSAAELYAGAPKGAATVPSPPTPNPPPAPTKQPLAVGGKGISPTGGTPPKIEPDSMQKRANAFGSLAKIDMAPAVNYGTMFRDQYDPNAAFQTSPEPPPNPAVANGSDVANVPAPVPATPAQQPLDKPAAPSNTAVAKVAQASQPAYKQVPTVLGQSTGSAVAHKNRRKVDSRARFARQRQSSAQIAQTVRGGAASVNQAVDAATKPFFDQQATRQAAEASAAKAYQADKAKRAGEWKNLLSDLFPPREFDPSTNTWKRVASR